MKLERFRRASPVSQERHQTRIVIGVFLHETRRARNKRDTAQANVLWRTLGAYCTHCLACTSKRMNLYLKTDPSFPCSIYYKKQIRTL